MKLKFTMLIAGSLLLNGAFAQQEGEPVTSPDQVPLGGFAGCFVQPSKNGCDARITCNGVGQIFGNTGIDLQTATKEADMEARNELAKFYSDKRKAQESMAKTNTAKAKSNASGGLDSSSEMTRRRASVSSSSAEALLSGVQVLGRKVDFNQHSVTVKVGVSCKSQAAAAKSQSAAASSGQPSGAPSAPPGAPQSSPPATFSIGAMKQGNMNQKTKNADDF